MTKFSKELRADVMMDIENGNSIKGAARKYGISSKTARKWYRIYQAGGIEQLTSSPQKYSKEFKVHAIEYRQKNGLSYLQAAADLGIPGGPSLHQWERIFLEQGMDGLHDTRKGRPPKMTKKKESKKKVLTREQELEAEIERLQMENDYLKKLNALVHEREKSKKKTK